MQSSCIRNLRLESADWLCVVSALRSCGVIMKLEFSSNLHAFKSFLLTEGNEVVCLGLERGKESMMFAITCEIVPAVMLGHFSFQRLLILSLPLTGLYQGKDSS